MTRTIFKLGSAIDVLADPPRSTADVARVLFDPVGWTVRCTPWRRTVMQVLPQRESVFRKFRSTKPQDARREWENLKHLAGLGFRVPQQVFLALRGRDSVLAMLAVSGRPLDALIREALAKGQDEEVTVYVLSRVSVLVRRLHGAGWSFRDLYWNHLFAESLASDGGEPALIDVERAFRPRWRSQRWYLKDLAGLLASWPEPELARPRLALRFLRSYMGGDRAGARQLLRTVLQKALRIRGHRPRYG